MQCWIRLPEAPPQKGNQVSSNYGAGHPTHIPSARIAPALPIKGPHSLPQDFQLLFSQAFRGARQAPSTRLPGEDPSHRTQPELLPAVGQVPGTANEEGKQREAQCKLSRPHLVKTNHVLNFLPNLKNINHICSQSYPIQKLFPSPPMIPHQT